MPPAPPPAQPDTAEADQPAPPAEHRSPRATMRTFLTAMNDVGKQRGDAWQRAIDCFEFDPATREDQRVARCRDLYFVLNRIERIDVDALPDLAAVEQQQLASYEYFPNPPDRPFAYFEALRKLTEPPVGAIELVRTAGGWKFSLQTLAVLPALREQFAGVTRVTGADVLNLADHVRLALPDHLVQRHLLSIEYWQWIALFLIIVVALSADLLLRAVMRVGARRLIHQQGGRTDKDVLARSARPFGILAGAVVLLLVLPYLDLTPLPYRVLRGAASVVATLAAILAAWRLTDLVAEVLIARAAKTPSKVDDVLYPLLRKAVKIFIVLVGIVYIAGALNVLDDIWPVLASLGLGSLAFAFAAKDTVENFFGSIAVLADRPFHVGDWVVTGDAEGIVEAIGFRSTRIRTFYNSLVTVPNANLVRAVVDNYGQRKYRRWKTHIGVQYDTPPDTIVAFTQGICELIRIHPYTRKDYFIVRLNEFADSSLNILLYVFHEVPDFSTELRERERLFLDIIRLADRLGVSFAFPTQTVHLYKEERTPHEAQHDTPQSMTERRAMVSGIKLAQQLVSNQPWLNDKPGPVIFSAGGPTYVEIDPATGEPLEEQNKTQIEDRTAGG